MAKEPPKRSDFPLPQTEADQHIADAAALADRDFEQFGWNKPKPVRKPRRRKGAAE